MTASAKARLDHERSISTACSSLPRPATGRQTIAASCSRHSCRTARPHHRRHRHGNREGEYEFKDLGEIYNPAFSPDGKQIAFSALKGGVLDLFVYTLEGGGLQQLTNDAFADLDPEWSPDGREIVWVTDRFSSNIETLSFGNYRIATMNVSARQPRQLAGFDSGRNSNPEFGPDGSLYFLATPDGIPNVYRLSNAMRGGSRPRDQRDLGRDGITPLAPAMSASTPPRWCTVFENDDYNLSSPTPRGQPRWAR